MIYFDGMECAEVSVVRLELRQQRRAIAEIRERNSTSSDRDRSGSRNSTLEAGPCGEYENKPGREGRKGIDMG